jgi:hypothetical protein
MILGHASLYPKVGVEALEIAIILERAQDAFDLIAAAEDLFQQRGALDPLTEQVLIETAIEKCRLEVSGILKSAEKILKTIPNGSAVIAGTEPQWRARSEALRDAQDALREKQMGGASASS